MLLNSQRKGLAFDPWKYEGWYLNGTFGDGKECENLGI
jgi:hypothetical protein